MTFLLLTALLVFYRPWLFLVLIPALLPITGFAPWTGWITFEELDFLVLASAIGGYARYAFDGQSGSTRRTSLLLLALAILMSGSMLISMARGFADAGGFAFGWFQGYDGPMNSVRIGKSFFLALLLVPLIARIHAMPGTDASRKLCLGIAIGLGTASLAALWERVAFTDLLNFSSDYRSTALFWEMHVGGAALDGWLLLTIPFAIWALQNARTTAQVLLSICLVGLATYASLTTFSRGVYLALMVSLPFLAWQTRKLANFVAADHDAPTWGFFRWMIALAALGTMTALVFPTSGYRGLLALLGLVAVALSMPRVDREISLSQFLAGSSLGLVFGALLVVTSNFLPKGPYIFYALLFFLSYAALYSPAQLAIETRAAVCLIGFFCLLLSAANVADYWGGIDALLGMCSALAIVLAITIWGAFSKRPLWPSQLRWQCRLITAAIAISAVTAVFVGGGYMGERFSTSSQDLDGRLAHWEHTVAMLGTPWDIAFGKGLGRFPANYYFAIPTGAFPGTYQVRAENGNSFLSLVAPRHPMSFGDILRISQRLSLDAQGPFELDLKVRTKTEVAIHVEVCEKHLLYVAACAFSHASFKGIHGQWQAAHVRLDGPALSGGPWYAPRFKMFSLGIGTEGAAADIDDVLLTTAGGENLIANGDFSNDMQHWFFSSDRDHMPWHAKNLLVSIFFDQGAVGLALFLLLTACALWRLNVGNAREHAMSPYLTAAIIGFLAVGLFDSLTDVPRLAFLYYLLTLYAVSLGTLGRNRTATQSMPRVADHQSRIAE